MAKGFDGRNQGAVDDPEGKDVFGAAESADSYIVAGVTLDQSEEIELAAMRAIEYFERL
ncbi:MAG: hypothetical protein ACREDR_23080 [Blastocatellia bacterium]